MSDLHHTVPYMVNFARPRRSDCPPLQLDSQSPWPRWYRIPWPPWPLWYHKVVLDPEKGFNVDVNHWKLKSVVTFTGKVVARTEETVNSNLKTGEVELDADEIEVQSWTEHMPFNVALETTCLKTCLQHRYIDLRQQRIHHNIARSKVISSLRRRMTEKGFNGSTLSHSFFPRRCSWLPLASAYTQVLSTTLPAQQFKQLLMVAGFDKYFQIAPCFRDEDARADRSPGEFYQLDMEMSYVTQGNLRRNRRRSWWHIRRIHRWNFDRKPFIVSLTKSPCSSTVTTNQTSVTHSRSSTLQKTSAAVVSKLSLVLLIKAA